VKGIRKAVGGFEKEHGIPPHSRKVIECSGSGAGQATAYTLLNYNAPDHFPPILELMAEGKIDVKPFVKRHPMSKLNDLLREESHVHRPVLIPDFEG
jgi:hypothetical protein